MLRVALAVAILSFIACVYVDRSIRYLAEHDPLGLHRPILYRLASFSMVPGLVFLNIFFPVGPIDAPDTKPPHGFEIPLAIAVTVLFWAVLSAALFTLVQFAVRKWHATRRI
jgi:hypothetical protein